MKSTETKSEPNNVSTQHKAFIQWETNVAKNEFPYPNLYGYPKEGEEHAVIGLTLPFTGYECEIHYTFGRVFPYRFMVNGKEEFVCDKLRDIMVWLKKKEEDNGK